MEKSVKKESFLAIALPAMLCCALWGSAFPCIKIGYRLFEINSANTADVILFAGMRFIVSGLLVLLIAFIGGNGFIKLKKDAVGSVLIVSMFQTILQYGFFYIGLTHTTGVKASIITGSNVFFVILISSLLFKEEKFTLKKFIGVAVGFVGGMMASSGTSGFLGALVAGFAAGYIILGLRKACEKLPEALEKIAPVLIYPVVGILAMGLLMLFIVEPIMGTVNTVLNNGLASMGGSSKLILGMILGGMMAIDMGGPFNKAAYVFGTAAIAAGNYDIMASVMIGGMVPPCAIALATLLFKDKFTKEERESGPTNFIMGLAFITEGAIPFAAADPIHVLPACIIGSGLAGALSMAFGCTLMAPHGGIFVVPVMGNALLYLVAVVIGTVVSAVLLGVLKKKAA